MVGTSIATAAEGLVPETEGLTDSSLFTGAQIIEGSDCPGSVMLIMRLLGDDIVGRILLLLSEEDPVLQTHGPIEAGQVH